VNTVCLVFDDIAPKEVTLKPVTVSVTADFSFPKEKVLAQIKSGSLLRNTKLHNIH